MTLEFTPLHPSFVSEASRIALREVDDQVVLDAIRDAMDEHAVVVFRDQAFEDDEQLAFARRFDGTLHEKTGSRVIAASRLGNEALTDVSNVAAGGGLLVRQPGHHAPRAPVRRRGPSPRAAAGDDARR